MVLFDRAIMELSSLTASVTLLCLSAWSVDLNVAKYTYMREFGFFFFFNIAVAVSSTCIDS